MVQDSQPQKGPWGGKVCMVAMVLRRLNKYHHQVLLTGLRVGHAGEERNGGYAEFVWQKRVRARTCVTQMTHMPSLKPLSLLCQNQGPLHHRRVIGLSQRKTYPPFGFLQFKKCPIGCQKKGQNPKGTLEQKHRLDRLGSCALHAHIEGRFPCAPCPSCAGFRRVSVLLNGIAFLKAIALSKGLSTETLGIHFLKIRGPRMGGWICRG